MSTQSAPSIPFTYTIPQQNYRLLELPPELLDLLTSDNPPTLHLKSAPPSTASPADTSPSTANENLHLCSPTATYLVRQVQSSNSVFIVRPTALPPRQPCSTNEDEEDDGGGGLGLNTTSSALTAIAQCPATLELVSVKSDAQSLLEGLVPVWHGRGEDEMEGESVVEEKRRGKTEVLGDTPVSEAEFEEAWRGLCCFEEDGVSYRPSARSCVRVWQKIMQAAVLHDVRIDDGEGGGVSRILGVYKGPTGEEELEEPWGLLEAVLRRVGDGKGGVKKETAVRLTGNVLLRAETVDNSKAVDLHSFLERWKALLPEKWREDARIDALDKGTYKMNIGEGTIHFVEKVSAKTSDGGLGASAPASASASNKRKWHEKFKAGRK